jgi:HEPN domain-containing protein
VPPGPTSQDLARLAGEHLARARDALDRGHTVEAVVWSSTAAEVAVKALAENRGIDTRRDHFRRASLARRIHEEGIIEADLGSLLIRLNNERKHALYEARQPDLRGRDWNEVLDAVGTLVVAAQREAAGERPIERTLRRPKP